MTNRLVLGVGCSVIVSASLLLTACSSDAGKGSTNGTGGRSATDSGTGSGGTSSAGGASASTGGASASAGGSSTGGSSAGAASSGGTGAGGTSSGTGAGCLQTSTLVTPAINVGCEEFLSSSDYTQGEPLCNGLHATGITYAWVTSCPTSKMGGCKVPPGAKGGAPGGSIRWQYSGTMTCAPGETKVDATGAPVATPDAGSVAKWDGTFGPGGAVSGTCFAALSNFTGTRWLACAGNCPSCNNGAGAPNDAVCQACIQKDYGAASCSTDKAFNTLFEFACNDTTFSIAKLCATECGH
jgi:hypothetical protein